MEIFISWRVTFISSLLAWPFFFANVSPCGFRGGSLTLFRIPLWPFLPSFASLLIVGVIQDSIAGPFVCSNRFNLGIRTFSCPKNRVCVGDSWDFFLLRFLQSTYVVNSTVIYLSSSEDFINISKSLCQNSPQVPNLDEWCHHPSVTKCFHFCFLSISYILLLEPYICRAPPPIILYLDYSKL